MEAAETKSLPQNAYVTLAAGENYEPMVLPQEQPPETTPRAIAWGLFLCIVFTVASAYSGLKVGQVMEAAIPIAILANMLGRTQVEAERTDAVWQRMVSVKPFDNQVHRVVAGFSDLKDGTRTASQRDPIGWRSWRLPGSGRRFPRRHRVEDHLHPPRAGGTRLDIAGMRQIEGRRGVRAGSGDYIDQAIDLNEPAERTAANDALAEALRHRSGWRRRQGRSGAS